MRGENSKVVLRCTDFQARPSHADQLHMNLWWNGVNIACDAGTYLYHGEGIWQNGLARTNVHNTVCVDGSDQMTHLSRFTWGNWSKGKVVWNGELDGLRIWQGEHDGYYRLSDPVKHSRSVMSLSGDRWLVVDRLAAAQVHCYDLQWLLADLPYKVVERQDGFEIKAGCGWKVHADDPWNERERGFLCGPCERRQHARLGIEVLWGKASCAVGDAVNEDGECVLLDVVCARGERGSDTGRD